MKKTLTLVIAVAVLVGGVAFYSGMKYSQGKVSQRFAQISGVNGGNLRGLPGQGRNGAGANGGFTAGDILSKDANSMTIKMRDGGSKIIFFGDATEISKFVTGALNDLAIGQSVSVSGKANSDGSITAQSIQIRPNMPTPAPAK